MIMTQINDSSVRMPYWGTDASGSIKSQFFWGGIIFFALATFLAAQILSQVFEYKLNAPFVGSRSVFEPRWLVRLRFSKGALPMVQEGYRKFKDSWFQLARNDRDILIVSNKYTEELRGLPNTKLSAIQALISNLGGKYSLADLLLESDLHVKVLQTKVTPHLPDFTADLKSDIDYGLAKHGPSCADWASVEIYEVILKLVARLSARVFVGEPACCDEAWLEASTKFSEQSTITVFTLRAVPKFVQPMVALLLPSYWNSIAWVRKGTDILIPIIHARRDAEKNNPDFQKPIDFLQGMIDMANERDGKPDKLARRALIMGLASIHLTTMAAAHIIYDICAAPEYFEPLREELVNALGEDGAWDKTTVNKLRKMDSFLRESQRMSPPSLLAFHRIVQSEPITLSDGKVIPAGAHVCIAAYDTSRDAANIPQPEFDGFRYYKQRQQHGEAQKHQFASTDKTHLHFGAGHNACPGRWFAAHELKMIVGELLLNYDMKFLEGQSRPKNINADEFIFADPKTRILMKRKLDEDGNLA